MAHLSALPPSRQVKARMLGFRFLQLGLRQYHGPNNTDAEDVQPAVHEVEQMGVAAFFLFQYEQLHDILQVVEPLC
jgi:hypothetical protein